MRTCSTAELLRNGSSVADQRPQADVFSVRSVAAHSPVLTAHVELQDIRPLSVLQIVFVRDNLVTFAGSG